MAADWTPANLPDLSGRVALVSGGSAGIGLDTARHLALHGAKVYFTAMSEEEGRTARDLVLTENPTISTNQLIPLVFDLTNLKSIVKLVEEMKSQESKLHLLINNAAIVPFKHELTENGWERAMATAHMGHFALTNGLMPLMKAAAADPGADVRIVSVASNVNTVALPDSYKLDYTSPSILAGNYGPMPWSLYILRFIMTTNYMVLYAMSKLANVMFAKELQRRLDEEGSPILSVSLHPGLVSTEFMLELWAFWLRPILGLFFLTPDQGSYHTLFVAADESIRTRASEFKGSYVEPVGVFGPVNRIAKDEGQVRGFWDVTTNALNTKLSEQGLPLLGKW